MIKVSVIVPVYNAEKYLRKCLDSLLCQSLKEVEVIAVNDGSPDNCMNILDEYQKKYPQLKVIDNVVNKGIGYSRNIGIEAAEGEYLTFVDSDDYVSEEYCERFYEFAEKNGLDFIHANMYLEKPEGLVSTRYSTFEPATLEENPEIITKVSFGPCGKMFKTEIIKEHEIKFEEKLKYEDLPFVAKAIKHSKCGFLEGNYYYYVIHESSQTTTSTRRNFDIFKILDIVNRYYQFKPYDEIEGINVMNVIWQIYMFRDATDTRLRNEFISKGFDYLDINFPNWRRNKYFKRDETTLTHFIRSHKLVSMIYYTMWNKMNK